MNNILSIPCFDMALEKKNMNLKQLADVYDEKYPNEDGKTIYNTLRNWHQGKGNPTLEKLIRICDILECDIDFLLGRIDNRTHNTEYICDTIGLTEDSIEKLKKLMTYETGQKRLHIINLLLSNTNFTHFYFDKLLQYQKYKKSYKFVENLGKNHLDDAIIRDSLNDRITKMDSTLFNLNKIHNEIIEEVISHLMSEQNHE